MTKIYPGGYLKWRWQSWLSYITQNSFPFVSFDKEGIVNYMAENADRVCWFSTLLREVFLWVLRFPPLWFTVSPISRVLDYWMNKGIFIIVFTIVIVYKTVDSNLKEFCASNVYFFDSSSQKNFKFQLWFLVQNSINLHVPKDAS